MWFGQRRAKGHACQKTVGADKNYDNRGFVGHFPAAALGWFALLPQQPQAAQESSQLLVAV
jgi:hypothetical protein